MENKNSDHPDIKINNSSKSAMPDIKTHLYRSDLFTGKTPDIRDIRKMMPGQRLLKMKETIDTDRSLNKFMEETPYN